MWYFVSRGESCVAMSGVLLVAACDVEAGQEVRFNYDGAGTGFREAMISRGVRAAQLDSGAYREARWRPTAWAMRLMRPSAPITMSAVTLQ